WCVLRDVFFFSSRRRHTRCKRDWSSDVCSSDLGGIYSWLAESIGERAAFIGTFIWLASWIVWMVSTASRIWITFSALIFGKDTTQHWSMLGLSSTEVIGILGILFIL